MTTDKLHINTFAGYTGETLEAMYATAMNLIGDDGQSLVSVILPPATYGLVVETLPWSELYQVRSSVDHGKPRSTIELALISYIDEAYGNSIGAGGFCEQLTESILPAMAENLSPIAEAIKASWTDLFNRTNPKTIR